MLDPCKHTHHFPTFALPVHDVFYSHQRLRGAVLAWSRGASQDDLDAVMAQVVSVALQRENLVEDGEEAPVWKGWRSADQSSLECEMVIESAPPLPACHGLVHLNQLSRDRLHFRVL